jgi:hypothetical protein
MATNQRNDQGTGKRSDQSSQKRSSGNNPGNFANMDDDKQREMASKGGRASHSGGSHRSH